MTEDYGFSPKARSMNPSDASGQPSVSVLQQVLRPPRSRSPCLVTRGTPCTPTPPLLRDREHSRQADHGILRDRSSGVAATAVPRRAAPTALHLRDERCRRAGSARRHRRACPTTAPIARYACDGWLRAVASCSGECHGHQSPAASCRQLAARACSRSVSVCSGLAAWMTMRSWQRAAEQGRTDATCPDTSHPV